MEDEKKESDDESGDEDLTELDALFDESIALIHQLEQSYAHSILTLCKIDASLQLSSSIVIEGKDLHDILDELHITSLNEIETSGSSSFGSMLSAVIDKIETRETS